MLNGMDGKSPMTLHLGAAVAVLASIRTTVAQHTGCPEWDAGGIRAALIATEGAPSDVLAAAALAAGDPELRLPSVNGFRAHWPKNASEGPRVRHTQRCPEHPDHDMPHDHGGDMTPEEIAAKVAEAKAAAAANPYRPPAARLAQPQEEA